MADEALREVFVRFSAEVEGEDELEHVGHAADEAKEHVKEAGEHAEHAGGLFKTLGEAVEGVAAVFGASELLRGVRETTTELAELAHLSEQTGVSAEKLEFLGFVVGQVGGDVGEFRSQLSALQRSLSMTEAGTAPQTAALKKLGIEARNADGSNRDMNAILPEIFENFGKLKDANEETAVATRLFGKSGLALLPVLREGKKGFEEYRASFEAAGGATPEEAIERAKEYEKALKRMNAAFGDLKTHLVTGVLPALTHVVEGVTDFTAGLSHFLKGTTAASHITLALAAALAGPLLTALAPFIVPGLKFAAIYLAVDDLLAFLEGKDSLIGRALESLFGAGTADKVRAWVQSVKDQYSQLSEAGISAWDAISGGLNVALDDMGIAIDGFFLDAYKKWNDFTGTFGKALGIDIDTSKAEEELKFFQKDKDDIAKRAYDRLNPAAAKERQDRDETARRGAADIGPHGGDTRTPAQQAAADAQIRNDPQALFRALRQQARDKVNAANPATAPYQAPTLAGAPTLGESGNIAGVVAELRDQARQRAQQADIAKMATAPVPGSYGTFVPGELGTGTRTTLNDNRKVSIQVGSNANAADVKKAVRDVLDEDRRATLQQLTQRGSK